MRSAVESEVARALVFLTRVESSLDNRLGVDVVVSEVVTGLSALKLCLCTGDINILMDAVHIVILPNRTNMIFLNLIRIKIVTAIANQNCLGKSLVHGMAKNLPLVSNNVELGDIENVVAVDLVLYIDGLSIMSTTEQLNVLAFLLVISLLITESLQLSLSSIRSTSADSCVGRLMHAVDNAGNPSIVGIKNLRLSRINKLIVGHQHIHSFFVKSIMLELIFVFIDPASLLETANTRSLCELENLVHCGMAEGLALVHIFLIKHVLFHFVSSFGMINFIFIIFAVRIFI